MPNSRPFSRRVAYGAGALGLAAGIVTVTGTAALAQDEPVAGPAYVKVTVENLAPMYGTWQSPFWIAAHDGSYDTFQAISPASDALETLAEDGDPSALATMFDASGAVGVDGVLAGPAGLLAPGEVGAAILAVDPAAGPAWFSFASMVVPSNDAFVGNDDPFAHPLFDSEGNFVASDVFVTGVEVLDAGTEFNDEVPEHTPGLGQMEADAGVGEEWLIESHVGYNALGSGGILDEADFAGADFSQPGYPVAKISFELLSELPADECTPLDEAPMDEEPMDEGADEVPVDEAPTDEVPMDEVPMDEVPMDEVPVDEVPMDEGVGETPIDETPTDEVPMGEDDVHDEDVSAECIEVPVFESDATAPVEEPPVDEVPTDEVPAEEPPVDEVPTDEVPVDEVPTDEVPTDEVPVDEGVDDAPVDTLPVDEGADAEGGDELPIDVPVEDDVSADV